MFWNRKEEQSRNEKVISVDMSNPSSPKVTVGKECTPEDVAEFFFRTTFMFEAEQYLVNFSKDSNPAKIIGEYIQTRTREYLISKAKEIQEQDANSEAGKSKPVVSAII